MFNPTPLVYLLAAGSQHDDRQIAAFVTALLADVEPAQVEQHDVQDDEIQLLAQSQTQARSSVPGDLNLVAFIFALVAPAML